MGIRGMKVICWMHLRIVLLHMLITCHHQERPEPCTARSVQNSCLVKSSLVARLCKSFTIRHVCKTVNPLGMTSDACSNKKAWLQAFNPWFCRPHVPRQSEMQTCFPTLTQFARCRYSVVFASANGDLLQQVADLIQSGKAIAPLDRVFPLEQAAEAHEYFENRKAARGKVVLQVCA